MVAIFNSFHLLPKAVVDMLVTLDTVLLAMAMAALGVTTHVSALKKPVRNRCDGAGALHLADWVAVRLTSWFSLMAPKPLHPFPVNPL